MRKEIEEFGQAMDDEMATHDDERGDEWRELTVNFLIQRLANEYHEFLSALAAQDANRNYDKNKARKELVDTANFCMMLWHRLSDGGE